MALKDPFAAYNASNNLEAHMVCRLLQEVGIEAMVIEDAAQMGGWAGPLPEISKPQVWIERADTERARPILTAYEQRNAQLRETERDALIYELPVEVLCEKCNKISTFPASQRGSTQNCPHCYAYVDVGDEVGFEGWDEPGGEDEPEGEEEPGDEDEA